MGDALVPAAPVVPELEALTPQERAFAIALAGGATRAQASEAAGYCRPGDGHRVARRADVRAAIRALVLARDAAAAVDFEGACKLLEAALLVRVSDLLVYADDGVTPIGVRPRESLSPAEELRVRKLSAKTHGSAKGQRAHCRWIEVELVSPLEVLDRLARLRSWTQDSPAFQVLLQTMNVAPAAALPQHGESLALLHEVAGELLQGPALDNYLRAWADGDQVACAELIRTGARELRAATLPTVELLPAEASRG